MDALASVITVVLPTGTRRFERLDDAGPFVAQLADGVAGCEAGVSRAEAEARDRRIAFGSVLLQLRAACRHGAWIDFLERHGINRRTAQLAMQVARAVGAQGAALVTDDPKVGTSAQPCAFDGTNLPTQGIKGAQPCACDGVPWAGKTWNELREAVRTPSTPSTLKPAPTTPTNDLTDFLDDNDDLPAPTAEDLAALAPYAAPHASPHASQQMAATPRPADDDTFRPEEYRPGAPASTATATLRLAGVPVDALGHAPVKPGALVKVGTQLGLGALYELAADTARRQDRLLARADTRDAAAAALREYHDRLERLEGGF